MGPSPRDRLALEGAFMRLKSTLVKELGGKGADSGMKPPRLFEKEAAVDRDRFCARPTCDQVPRTSIPVRDGCP